MSREHLTWPTDRFYWTLVEGAAWRGSGPLPPGVLGLAEDDIPEAIDNLHAVGVPTEQGVLVCAARRNELQALDDAVLSLRPAACPIQSVDAEKFNLLVGVFEPRCIRRARIKRHAVAASALLLCGLSVTTGLSRRGSFWNEQAVRAERAWMAAATEQSPDAPSSTILLDLQRLAGTLESTAALAPPQDATAEMATLLEHWPARVTSKPQSIAIRGGVVSVSVLVEDAAAFLAAITLPNGWSMDQPMLNSAGNLTRLSLTFHADDGTSGEGS
jgi:hypothetical protein